MILILNEINRKPIRSFQSDEIFNHISADELLEDHPEVDKAHWNFIIFPPEDVAHLFFKLKKASVTAPIRQAYVHQLGIIEICKGDYADPTWVLLTCGLDIGKLKKEWYFECCEKHGHVVTENHEGDFSPEVVTAGDIR
jgi:hypothetical protein